MEGIFGFGGQLVQITEKDNVECVIPLFRNCSYGLRQPLPWMVFRVQSQAEKEAIYRQGDIIKDELNIKQLIVVCEED